MWQRVKDVLNSSAAWFLFLVSCILYLWKKEKDVEFKLEETKANDAIKQEKKAVDDADAVADSSEQRYEELRRQYLNDKHD